VVIAIIGILSSVVLSALNTARTKGSDTAIKSNLSGARSQAELFYDANDGSYDTVCTNVSAPGGIKSIYANVLAAAQATGLSGFSVDLPAGGSTGTAVCNDGATGWLAQVQLKSNSAHFFCVDSSGAAITNTYSMVSNAVDYRC
jgi:type II secretory pathway pseudopilin PulG